LPRSTTAAIPSKFLRIVADAEGGFPLYCLTVTEMVALCEPLPAVAVIIIE